jgi:RNA polymerase-binding transcription factor DksA
MSFFKSKQNPETPDWIPECKEIQERWFVFLNKLEDKMQELCETSIPELENTFVGDETVKSTYYKLLSGIKGQLNQIRKKARDAYEEKIEAFYNNIKCEISVFSPYYHCLSDFRTACSERYCQGFDKRYEYWNNKLEEINQEDFEQQYQDIITEFELTKNAFYCTQCGGNIPLEKIYIITTAIKCTNCQTQNTFEPSSLSRNLEHIGREVAEKRTEHLKMEYLQEVKNERDLYFRKHELELSKDKNQKEIDDLNILRQKSIKNAPILYEKYLRAMFDEWNKIVPDLIEQNEKFYQWQLTNFRKTY